MSMRDVTQGPRRLVEGGDGSPEDRALRTFLEGFGSLESGPYDRERVWRLLTTRRARGSRRRRLGAAVAATAVGALVALIVVPTTPDDPGSSFCVVSMAEGDVFVGDAPTHERVRQGARLREGARITTAQNSRAIVRFDGGSRVLLDYGTESVLHRAGDGESIFLARGRIVATVRPSEKSTFVVFAHAYRVEVAGTVFAVSVQPRVTEVRVVDGAVRVSGPATALRVEAGQCWSSRTGIATACSDAGDEAWLGALARLGVTPERSSMQQPPVDVARPTAGNKKVRNGKGLRRQMAAPTAEPAAAPASLGDPVARLRRQIAAAESEREREHLLYELGVVLARLERYAAATRAFRKVAERRGAHEELALYELGRIEQRYLHDSRAAQQWLERYRRRFPSGALRQEVDLTLIESLSSDQGRALTEIDAFLTSYPRTERRIELWLLRANLLRGRGECGAAVEGYDRVLTARTSGPLAEDALYFAAVCESQSGHPREAWRRLARYIERFPRGKHRLDAERALGTRDDQ